MPNDAKLGMVIGVGLVLAVAVLFFRRDDVTAAPQGVSAVSRMPAVRGGIPSRTRRVLPAQPAGGAQETTDPVH